MLTHESLQIHQFLLDTSTNVSNMNIIQKKRYDKIKSMILQSDKYKEKDSLHKTKILYQLSIYISHEQNEEMDNKWIEKYINQNHNQKHNQIYLSCFCFLHLFR